MKKLLALLTLVCVSFNVSGAGAKELKYIDASTLTILNKPQPDGPRLSRLDTDKYPDFTPTVRKYYKMSTGMAVSFHTNSPVIAAKWCNDKEHRSTSCQSDSQQQQAEVRSGKGKGYGGFQESQGVSGAGTVAGCSEPGCGGADEAGQ